MSALFNTIYPALKHSSEMLLTLELSNFTLIQGRQPTLGSLLYARPVESNFHIQVSKWFTCFVDLDTRLYYCDTACHLEVYNPTINLEFSLKIVAQKPHWLPGHNYFNLPTKDSSWIPEIIQWEDWYKGRESGSFDWSYLRDVTDR